MKKIVLCLFVLLFAAAAYAGESGQSGNVYTNGSEGIQGGSLPPPGVYVRWYNIYQAADTLKDSDGNSLPVNMKVGAAVTVPRFIWSTPQKALGGNVVLAALIPVGHVDFQLGAANYHQASTHVGDPDITSLIAWHGPKFDAAAGAD